MEKFSKFSDKFTGTQPFLPPQSKIKNKSQKFLYFWKWYLIGPLLALIRLPIVLVLFLWLIVVDELLHLIIFVSLLRRMLQRINDMIVARLILFVLGFYFISAKYVPSKKKNKIPTMWPVGRSIRSGDIIICNHVSYIELFYLTFRFSPQFVAIPTDSHASSKRKVIPQTLLSALWTTIRDPLLSSDRAKDLSEIAEEARVSRKGPVVVFPEGTTTNGVVLLGCAPIFSRSFRLHSTSRIHLIGFKYEYTDFSPVFTVGSFVVHLFRMCSQFYNTLQVRYVVDDDIPPLPSDPQQIDEWNEQLYSLLAAALQIRRAKINFQTKHEFKEYYYKYKKDYTPS